MSRFRRLNIVPLVILVACIALVVSGCFDGERYGGSAGGPSAPGGDTTVADRSVGAFSQPATNLSDAEVAMFRVGDSFFTEPWTPAGEGHADRDGLGPTYLTTSCAGCHRGDGRDAPPVGVDQGGTPIVRFAEASGDAVILDAYGVQLQTLSIHGVPAEGIVDVEWLDRAYEYPDGVAFALRRPSVNVRSLSFGPLAVDSSGIRLAPNLIGLGLLEAIPEAAIRANADTEDVDDNGISGVAPEVFSEGVSVLGRFGLKSNVATVADQAAIAYHFDLGITSPRFPAENCPEEQITCTDAASGGFPEISAERLAAVVFYAQTLGVPTRVGVDDESVIAGEQLFDDIDCTACHTRRWVTGIHEVESLSHQVIYPYTDMLLHDMGEDLSDGRTDGTATASEWRTSPLWGLGLVRTVNPDAGFLHDGRARSIEEAVLWHGGEGSTSRDLFVELSAQDRTFLLLFLKSL